jgi:enoyl-CoA hydratase
MSDDSSVVLVERRRGGVALIRLNRPNRLNALDEATLHALAEVLTQLAADDSVHAVVLTGDRRAFAAGADVTEMQGKSAVAILSSPRPAFWETFKTFPKPLIAAVSGWCLGGGNELAMSCDMIIASETAKFGQPEVNLAIMPGAGGTQRLTHAVGKAVTMEMVLAGRFLSAEEAHVLGLVNRVAPVELYLDKALALAEKIASQPPLAVRLAKESVLKAFEMPLEEGLAFERRNYYFLYASEDKEEGIAAFLEKRPAQWKGR